MNKQTTVIEPPFIEPGMPYPDIFKFSSALKELGIDASPLDLNVRLYRSILQDGTAAFNPELITASAQKAFFTENKEPGPQKNAGSINLDAISLSNELRTHALPFFTGKISQPSHSAYVTYSELLNTFLDCRVKEIDSQFELWLDHFSSSIDIRFSENVFNGIWGGQSKILKLYDKYIGEVTDLGQAGKILILIRKEEQLFPGLALSYWLRSRGHFRITLAGDFLTSVLTMNFPKDMFKLCDTIILHPLEYSLESWAAGKTHPNIIGSMDSLNRRDGGHSTLKYDAIACHVEAVNTDNYFSPVPVAGAQVTSRCYWSRCKFCNLAKASIHPFRQCSPSEFHSKLEALNKFSDLKHLQFLDYALPFSLFQGRLKTRSTLSLRWAAQLRFERFCLEKNIFETLYRKGCRTLSWGFESGSSEILEDMYKGGVIRINERREILKSAAEAGINNHLFVIAGYPGESDQNFMMTVEFLMENMDVFHSVETYAYQPIHGTETHKELLKNGMIAQKGDWNLKFSYLDKELQTTAEIRSHFIEENFLHLSRVNRCNDLLEGHMVFHYILKRNEQ